jgi:hypothetical protein
MNRVGRCANLNHGRANAPVRHCPMCGEVVNETVAMEACSEEKHASGRRRGSTYCVDCGKRLVMTK